MCTEKAEEIAVKPNPDDLLIEQVVLRLYAPDNGEVPEEVLSHTDVLNSVRAICPGCDSETLYRAMGKLEFPSRTIEGVIYWFVKEPGLRQAQPPA